MAAPSKVTSTGDKVEKTGQKILARKTTAPLAQE
jgi:hypothetical protein